MTDINNEMYNLFHLVSNRVRNFLDENKSKNVAVQQ